MGAPGQEAKFQKYKDRGYQVVAMMVQDKDRQPATPEALMRWKTKHGVNHVLMAAPISVMSTLFTPMTQGFPSAKLLAPEMIVSVPGPYVQISDSQIESVLPN